MTSNLDPFGGNPFVAIVQWINGTLLGSVATAVAIIAVAACGLLLLSGRIDVRRGVTVIFGCFILFGASAIAAGIMLALGNSGGATMQTALAAPPIYSNFTATAPIAASPYDPYAGAAMPARQ